MQRKKELSPMISEFIFYDEDSTKEEASNYISLKIEIRQLIKDDFNREVLSEVLLDLRKDVSGDTQKRLFKLYKDLDLHVHAFSKLNSMRWHVVSNAIKDLTQMQVTEAYVLITKFINDKRATIRKQAEIAVVTLEYEGLNYFLDTTKHKISEWQQLKLLDVIRNNANYEPPRFKAWLTSNNSYVVLFALRLIKFYNQNDANKSLIELIKHRNNQIKQEAIKCIKEFHVLEALETLKTVFWKSSTDLKISILDTIGSLGTEKDIEFLQLIEKKESNFYVKSKALNSINTIDPERIMPSIGILDTSNYKIPDDIPSTYETNNNDTSIAESVENPQLDLPPTINDNTEVVMRSPEKGQNVEAQEKKLSEDEKSFDIPDLDFSSQEVDKLSTDKEPMDTNAALNSLRNLQVIYEELTDKETSEENNTILKEGPKINEKEFKTNSVFDDLAFLPIVVDTIEEETTEILSSEKTTDSIHDISVQFEIVTAIEDKIDFSSKETNLSSFDQYNTADIFNIIVESDEISKVSTEEQTINNIEVIAPDFIPFDIEEMDESLMDDLSNERTVTSLLHEEMSPKDEEKFRKIINSFIDFENKEDLSEIMEEIQSSSLQESEDESIDMSFIPFIEAAEETMEAIDDKAKSEKAKNDEIEQPSEIKTNEAEIPNAILSEELYSTYEITDSNPEEVIAQLLDDISEYGDSREVLLLNDMLVSEKYGSVKERVKKLIHRFTEDDVEKTTKLRNETFSLRAFNVFEDLFRTSDTEAKLILLDEMVHVGDQDDIEFLESLLKSDEEEIQNKAAQVLEGLRIKFDELKDCSILNPSETVLTDATKTKKQVPVIDKDAPTGYASLMKELEINPSNNASDIFELTFEITPDDADDTTMKEHSQGKASQKSFMGQICDLTDKILEKFNG